MLILLPERETLLNLCVNINSTYIILFPFKNRTKNIDPEKWNFLAMCSSWSTWTCTGKLGFILHQLNFYNIILVHIELYVRTLKTLLSSSFIKYFFNQFEAYINLQLFSHTPFILHRGFRYCSYVFFIILYKLQLFLRIQCRIRRV